LVLDSVSARLGGREVLADVSLTARAGEVTGIIGPNGAGKTTLLRAVLGLVPTSAGSIQLGGEPGGARHIGYVPQRHEFAWDFPTSVEDAVLSGRVRRIGWLRRAGVADYRAVFDAIDRVELTDLRRRPIGELSGGQRQRVLVARALALRPAVLLLDEPTTGLDIPTQELLMALLDDLARDGTAVVMTTHDLVDAVHRCAHLCLLNRSVIAAGPPRQLRSREVWMRGFGFSPASPLLALLAPDPAARATANGGPR
jgi:manganese/iron transport system ATP-binding protein